MVSVTTTATSTPSSSCSAARSAGGEASGSAGSRASSSRRTLEASTPAAASTSPCWFATIRVCPRRATTRTRLGVDELAAQPVARLGVGGRGDEPALDLGDDLAGDDHDVAVGQPRRRGRRAPRPGRRPGRNSGRPGTGRIRRPPSRRGREAQATGAPQQVQRRAGHRRRSRRGRSSAAAPDRTSAPGTSAVSPVSTSQPSSSPPSAPGAVVAADRLGGDLDADRGAGSASAMPRTGRPATIGERPTTRAPRVAQRVAEPRDRQDGPMVTTGFDGASSTASAPAIASRAAGRTVASSAPTGTKRCAGSSARWRTHHSWKWIACCASGRSPGRRRRRGSRPGRRSSAAA